MEWLPEKTSSGGLLSPEDILRLLVGTLLLYILFHAVCIAYNALFGPLSSYPGPLLRAFTVWPKVWTICTGREASDYPKLHQKYGPVVRTAPNELSYVGSRQTFKEIYGFKKAGVRELHKDPLFYGRPLNGIHNILTADEENHARQRKIVSSAFSDRALKDLEPMLKSWVRFMVEKLDESVKTGEEVDMVKYYNCTTFDIMADLCFNESLHMLENKEYSPWVKTIFRLVRVATFFRGIRYLGSSVRSLVDNLIANTKTARRRGYEHWRYCAERVDKRMTSDPERADLWDKIMEKNKGPEPLTLDEHYATAVVFMGAGTETTATVLSGLTYHLLQNPAMMARLVGEIRTVFPDLEAMTLDGLQSLEYLNAVINEGLRMYPPIPAGLPRIVPAGGASIGGRFVPEGTAVSVHHLATYRSKENFIHAYEFHPERWLREAGFEDDNLIAVEPFMVGPRNCLGKNLAWHEIRLILATTLLHFDLHLGESMDSWADQKVYFVWEKGPLLCSLKAV